MVSSRTVWMILLVLCVGACRDLEAENCSDDRDCGALAVCVSSVCVRSELPGTVITLDRTEARIGETVLVDASTSYSRTGAVLSWEFTVEPEGAALIESSTTSPGVAWYQVAKPHVDVVAVVSVTDTLGNTSVARRTISAVDSPPVVRLSAEPHPFQPGDIVSVVVDAEDPDGDELSFRWALAGSWGSLIGTGDRAQLQTVPNREEIVYRVSVVVSANGEEAMASLDLSGRNRAPVIHQEEAPSAHHQCHGDAEGCISRIPLVREIDDVGQVRVEARVLVGLPGVGISLESNGSGGYDAVMTCRPVCRIAGSYRIEVTATDDQGLTSTMEIAAQVLNRPPVLTAHDGSILPHGKHQSGLYRVERAQGKVLVWSDPDGDPPDLSRTRWTASSSIVAFLDPGAIDPALAVIGTKEQLSDLWVSVTSADINGAEASDTKALPVGNRKPVIYFAGDPTEGHEYAGAKGDVPIFQKAMVIPVEDPDGDPVDVFVQPLSESLGVTVQQRAGGWYLQVEGPSLLGQSHRVRIMARDSWGGTSEVEADVRISNTPPVVVTNPAGMVSGTGCSRQTCCGPAGCPASLGAAMVLTHFDQPGPAHFRKEVRVFDADGDPVRVVLVPRKVEKAFAYFRDATTTAEIPFDEPRELRCTKEPSGELVCPYEVRLYGKSETGASCRIDTGTAAYATLHLSAELDDGIAPKFGTGFTLGTLSPSGACQ